MGAQSMSMRWGRYSDIFRLQTSPLRCNSLEVSSAYARCLVSPAYSVLSRLMLASELDLPGIEGGE